MKLSEREQRLCRAIEARADDLLNDLRLHVGLPTGGNNTPALDETRERFVARLERLGATTEVVPGDPRPDWIDGFRRAGGAPAAQPTPTAVCTRTGDGPSVMIAGHLDTVHDPAGPFRELTVEPGGKRATGPGCVDMKGGLVIAVAALEALEETGFESGGAWTFLLNSDEETGSYHSQRAIAGVASRHDWGLAIEPALPGGELAIERMGSGQFMVEVRGRAAHVGREFEKGVSAVTGLACALVKIADMPDPARGRIMSVGPLVGGAATNAVPDLARAWGNVRFPTQKIADEAAALLDSLATAGEALPSVRVEKSFVRAAKPLIPETERLGLLAREAAEALGQSLPFASKGGVCDGNVMQAAGLPTIDTLGVRGGGLHTPDEWIDLTSLVERCQLLAVTISRLCAGALGSRRQAGAAAGSA